jgi:hypothetical protein
VMGHGRAGSLDEACTEARRHPEVTRRRKASPDLAGSLEPSTRRAQHTDLPAQRSGGTGEERPDGRVGRVVGAEHQAGLLAQVPDECVAHREDPSELSQGRAQRDLGAGAHRPEPLDRDGDGERQGEERPGGDGSVFQHGPVVGLAEEAAHRARAAGRDEFEVEELTRVERYGGERPGSRRHLLRLGPGGEALDQGPTVGRNEG